MRWVAGMHNQVNPRLAGLYQRAVICQTFPAYKLEDLDDAPLGELMQALELLTTARQVQTPIK